MLEFLQDYIVLAIATFFGLAGLTAKIMNLIMNVAGQDDHPYLSWLIGGAAGTAIFVISMDALIPALIVSGVIAVGADLVLTKLLDKAEEALEPTLDKAADKFDDAINSAFGKMENRDVRKIMTSPDKDTRVKHLAIQVIRMQNGEFRFHADADYEIAKQVLLAKVLDSDIAADKDTEIIHGAIKENWGLNIKCPHMTIYIVLCPGDKILIRLGVSAFSFEGHRGFKESRILEQASMETLDDLRFMVSEELKKFDPAFTVSFEKKGDSR